MGSRARAGGQIRHAGGTVLLPGSRAGDLVSGSRASDVRNDPSWTLGDAALPDVSLLLDDPLRLAVTFELDGDSVTAVVEADASVSAVERGCGPCPPRAGCRDDTRSRGTAVPGCLSSTRGNG